MIDLSYKYPSSSSFSLAKKKINENALSITDNQNEECIDSILSKITDSIELEDEDETLSLLQILDQKKELEFTLQVVESFQLFDKLIFLGNVQNQEIQNCSISVLNLALNQQTIQYSIDCKIIPFLIDVINSNNQTRGFFAIESLSKIASYNYECHNKVIFYLASLNILQDEVTGQENETVQNDGSNIIEYIVKKGRFGKKKYIPYQKPGILPEDSFHESNIEKVRSFQNLNNYIQYTENGNDFICIPSLHLIASLLEFELNPFIISYCLETLVSLIPISNIQTLVIILRALCLLSKQKKELWNDVFQITDPYTWLDPLFEQAENTKSFKIIQLLMFFISNVIKQGVMINGLPFDLLIEKLQFQDEKTLIATYAASAIDSMIKNCQSSIDAFIKLDLLIVTKNVFPNLSFSAKALIVSYLTRISQFGLIRHRVLLIDMDLISFLIDAIIYEYANEELLLHIFLSLNELLECAEKQADIYDHFNQQIVDNIDTIQEFQDHENSVISKLATEFVNKFFHEMEEDEYDDDDSGIFDF